ncbi:hypothetical protein MAL08_05430 [Leptospira noguchii]|uniref:hypothetical protein n=1 Tax=Leptospira noguchii TaxID=28182 RepID=UPI001FB5BA8F|nr:hypothetical protein [Leptospira noguchii]UOG38742.1 hypothetical protein MAL08_05430 [Leptospira noguchii]
MERKRTTQRLASMVVRQVVSQSTIKFASCDDDPGNSVNAYLWVGVQGVVALSLLFAPIFLRRTHVKIHSLRKRMVRMRHHRRKNYELLSS